ncbi:MAG: cysteine desulfurase [Planctomycetaceae bacterium]|jgi:cysteine desulfurase/selenocysteine lyase|nr:cysteine desulfurase [Planctomycetaceae bacterium]
MNTSTLDNLVYAAVVAADAGEEVQFADKEIAGVLDNVDAGGGVPNDLRQKLFSTQAVSNLPKFDTQSQQRETIVQGQSLMPVPATVSSDYSGYMDDFFTDQSPFVADQISTAVLPIDVQTDVSNIPNSPETSPKIPSQLSQPNPVLRTDWLDWDVQRIGQEISKTLYNNNLDDISRVAFDLVDNNLQSAVNLDNANFNNNQTDSKNGSTLSANNQPKSVSGLSREFDIVSIRNDFPILSERVHGKPLVWFDNGATTQKPRVVIERLRYFYEHENSNVHRGAHDLAARSTDAYEQSRETVRKFLNAASVNEIIFVRGTTEAINLVASAWGRDNIHAGDEIVISHLEHHANIVPWQLLAAEVGAVIRVIPVNSKGELLISNYTDILRSGKVKLVAVTQVSNAIGTITPAEEIVQIAHQFGAVVLIDGAQSVPHLPTDVQTLGADFFVFSGHKIFAPTGIGVLYGKESILNSMRPYQSGGGMISDVTFDRTTYNPAPSRFEAGTGNIADAVGLGAALDYVGSIGLESIRQYEHRLLEYALGELGQIAGVQVVGGASNRAAVISFLVDGFTTDEVNKRLATEGIAVRAGHHCAQPILRHFGQESTVRASLAFYNTYEEIDFLVKIVKNIYQSRHGR